MTAVAILILAAIGLGAWLYVRRARHPQVRPMAAYLIFLTVFCAFAVAGYVAVGLVLATIDDPALVESPLLGLTLLAATLVPAFLAARHQIRRPPLTAGSHD